MAELQELTCEDCGLSFKRLLKRGTVPKRCDSCKRERVKVKNRNADKRRRHRRVAAKVAAPKPRPQPAPAPRLTLVEQGAGRSDDVEHADRERLGRAQTDMLWADDETSRSLHEVVEVAVRAGARESGRQELGAAVRELAKAMGADATYEGLLEVAAEATAWARQLRPADGVSRVTA